MQMFFYGNMVSTNPSGAEILQRAGARLVQAQAVVEGYKLVSMGQAPIAVRSTPLHGTMEYVIGEVWDVPDGVYLQMTTVEREAGFREGSVYWQVLEGGLYRVSSRTHAGTARMAMSRLPDDFGYSSMRDIDSTAFAALIRCTGQPSDFLCEAQYYRWRADNKTVTISYNVETRSSVEAQRRAYDQRLTRGNAVTAEATESPTIAFGENLWVQSYDPELAEPVDHYEEEEDEE